MPLHLHRAQRSDALVGAMAQVLAEPLDDPMATEVIAVPARGVERWLTQRLSHRLGTDGTDGTEGIEGPAVDAADGGAGVCANVEFPPPTALVQRLISAAAGIDPQADPWQVDRMVWPLLETIDTAVATEAARPWCAPLAAHLGAGPRLDAPDGRAAELTELRRSRRLTLARRVAGLFTGYGNHRPAILNDWSAGRDTDGCGRHLEPTRAWQPELFRRLRSLLDVPSPAERLNGVCARLRDEPGRIDLPERISVFGPTRLSTTELRVLDAVAQHRDVHVWLPQPSPQLWARLAASAADAAAPVRRSQDRTAQEPRHPLLRSLGSDSRELQLRLGAGTAGVTDEVCAEISAAPGVLGLLQRHLSDDRPPAGAAGSVDERAVLDPADRSIAVHACHGRDRQVEVLRDVLVGLLADDPTLQPRDILVMCPDIESYAPLILAAFGAPGDDTAPIDGAHPGTTIRVRLADRALRRTNPVLDVLARLLELAGSRMTASDVLDFAGLPPVRRRFGLDDDDAERLRDWVIDAGIRWGLNAEGRRPYGLHEIPNNTWRAGLDRILLGAAMAEDEPCYLGTATPLDDVDSADIDLAGRLAELVDRLAIATTRLSGVRPLDQWVDTLTEAVDSLAAVGDADAWQADQAHRMIAESLDRAGARGQRIELRLPDVTGLLSDALRGRPTRANFRTGELTICSMVPMRSVPHRVVCLMGMDDGEFPRAGQVDGDDVLTIDPVIGEHDRTSEDRQLLLDAINAATEHLVFLYSGADVRTGAQRPPAAALGEILDVLDDTVRLDGTEPARTRLLVRHPLQPFDSRNFVADELVPGRPFSFDAQSLAAARAGAVRGGSIGGPSTSGFLLDEPLPPPAPEAQLELESLVRFAEQPARHFLAERLGLSMWKDSEEIPDELDVDLDGLARWGIGERMLSARLAGVDPSTIRQAELRRGTLPPGREGSALLDELSTAVEPLVAAATRFTEVSGERYSIDVTLPDGRGLVGSVGPLRDGAISTVSFSKLAAKQRVRAWVGLLALAASEPGFAPRALTIGRGGGNQPVAESRMAAPPPDRALALLADLVALREVGLRQPLPLSPKTAMAYVRARREDRDPVEAMARATTFWDDGTYPGEGDDPAHRTAWGKPGLAAIVDALGPSVNGNEPTLFGELAVRAYWGLLIAEEVGGR